MRQDEMIGKAASKRMRAKKRYLINDVDNAPKKSKFLI